MPSNHPKLPRVHQSIAAKLTCFEQKPRHFRVLGTARVAIRLQSKERWLPHRCSRAFGSRVLSLWTSWNLVCTHHWCCCYDPGDHEPLLWMAKHLRHHDLSDLEKWRFDLDDKGPQKQNMSKLSNTQRKLIRKWSISLILPPKNHQKKKPYILEYHRSFAIVYYSKFCSSKKNPPNSHKNPDESVGQKTCGKCTKQSCQGQNLSCHHRFLFASFLPPLRSHVRWWGTPGSTQDSPNTPKKSTEQR